MNQFIRGIILIGFMYMLTACATKTKSEDAKSTKKRTPSNWNSEHRPASAHF